MTALHRPAYFGEPWPSGICDEGFQAATPVGDNCALCDEAICDGDQGQFIAVVSEAGASWLPQHRECTIRSIFGGIGHFEDHRLWCHNLRDPDAGLSYRESAVKVWDWVKHHGTSVG